jgi:hypothetical protein
MLADLKDYYRRMGISADGFLCPFFTICSRYNPASFTTAKESFVSSGYENHTLPRILFLSLDSGSASHDPADKTLESVRRQEEVECQVSELPRNKHWFRTHELAFTLLRNFSPGLALEDAKHYFAHANSAKCCQNNPQRGQANSVLFDNCRVFIPGEVEILAPDVLITQGEFAHRAIDGAFPQREMAGAFPDGQEIPEEISLLSIDGKPVIWIRTYHPRNPNSKMNRDNYQSYEKIVFEFVEQQPLPLRGNPTHLKPVSKQPRSIVKEVSPGREEALREGNYIYLDTPPETPDRAIKVLKQADCVGYEYMEMVQLCDIAEKNGKTRGWAHNAFGGDRGKIHVEPARMARAAWVGRKLRKYALVSAVIDYFKDSGIQW